MPHNRRGLLFAMVAALALLVAGARTAWAQDAVVRGTITSERGEPIPGANVVVEELRIGVVTSATGQYALNVPGARVRYLAEISDTWAKILRFIVKLDQIWKKFMEVWNATIGPILETNTWLRLVIETIKPWRL